MRLSNLLFLCCMILHFQKEKLKFKLNIYSLSGISRGSQKSSKRKQRLYEKFFKKEQRKIKLYIRSINIYLKELLVIIGIN